MGPRICNETHLAMTGNHWSSTFPTTLNNIAASVANTGDYIPEMITVQVPRTLVEVHLARLIAKQKTEVRKNARILLKSCGRDRKHCVWKGDGKIRLGCRKPRCSSGNCLRFFIFFTLCQRLQQSCINDLWCITVFRRYSISMSCKKWRKFRAENWRSIKKTDWYMKQDRLI